MAVSIVLIIHGQNWGFQKDSTLAGVLYIVIIFGARVLFACKDMPKEYRMKLKKGCLPHVIKLFNDIEWENNGSVIPDEKLVRSGLFMDFNIRHTDDEFVGSYKDVPFKISETSMQHECIFENRRRRRQVFKGIVISFKFNKLIKNRTIIATKGDKTQKNVHNSVIFGVVGVVIWLMVHGYTSLMLWAVALFAVVIYSARRRLGSEPLNDVISEDTTYKQEQLSDEPFDEVILEDPRFCKKFNAYSSDQVEARYLLTTAFIERFQNLRTAFGAEKAKCSFIDDEIMIAITTYKNLFEIGSLFTSLKNPKSINNFYNELSSIYSIIEYFKLDQKLGL